MHSPLPPWYRRHAPDVAGIAATLLLLTLLAQEPDAMRSASDGSSACIGVTVIAVSGEDPGPDGCGASSSASSESSGSSSSSPSSSSVQSSASVAPSQEGTTTAPPSPAQGGGRRGPQGIYGYYRTENILLDDPERFPLLTPLVPLPGVAAYRREILRASSQWQYFFPTENGQSTPASRQPWATAPQRTQTKTDSPLRFVDQLSIGTHGLPWPDSRLFAERDERLRGMASTSVHGAAGSAQQSWATRAWQWILEQCTETGNGWVTEVVLWLDFFVPVLLLFLLLERGTDFLWIHRRGKSSR